MAFDKCTLLSSQGSDAPTTQPSRPGPQGNFSILPISFPLSSPSFFGLTVGTDQHPSSCSLSECVGFGRCSMLDGSRSEDLRSTVWGEQVITYVGSGHRANHRRFPGVSPVPLTLTRFRSARTERHRRGPRAAGPRCASASRRRPAGTPGRRRSRTAPRARVLPRRPRRERWR